MPAMAKVNLCLEVDGTRPDGYHALWSVMHSIALSDAVSVSENHDAPGLRLALTADLPEDNTFTRSYAAFTQAHPETARSGILVRCDKNIPSQAGLGGASADSAAMLTLLHRMFEKNTENIFSLGASVGSDVPFCLMGGCALAQGRGEILTPLRAETPTTHLLLIKCEKGVSTRELFRIFDEQQTNNKNPESIEERDARRAKLLAAASENEGIEFDTFRKYARNDLEPAVFALLPEVADAKKLLYDHGARFALMTGSGSTVFGVFDDTEAMEAALLAAKKHGYAFVHKTRLTPELMP